MPSFWDIMALTPTPIGLGYSIYKRGIKGEKTGNPLWDELFPVKQQRLDARPPIGGGSEIAARQARELQSVLNRQLTESIIPAINREWGTAGRFNSGLRPAAIGRAATGAQQALAGSTAQNLAQIYMTELGLSEERAWRQAQLDAGQPSLWESGGEILPYLLMMMKMGMI